MANPEEEAHGAPGEEGPELELDVPEPGPEEAPPPEVQRREDCGDLLVIVRDFSDSHPDMERGFAIDWTNPLGGLLGEGLKGIEPPQRKLGVWR
jgi:hypothetical protein